MQKLGKNYIIVLNEHIDFQINGAFVLENKDSRSITVKRAREILNGELNNLSDDQIQGVLDDFYAVALVGYEDFTRSGL